MHVPTLPKLASGAALALTLLGIGACDNGPTDPGTTRFGQVGQIRVHVITPEPPGNGSLEQIMEWESDGPWNVTERISYRGQLGDENVQRLRIDLDTYASNYATVIAQLNENEGLKLFLDSLPPGEDPNCAADRTEVIVVITDDNRRESRAWAACTFGSLADLQIAGTGPKAASGRVSQAAVLVREFTVGGGGGRFESVYRGTTPFATVDRGGESGADMTESRVILNQSGWEQFWERHMDGEGAPPAVDFEVDQVIVGAMGPRFEAGDSIEVRRILQVEGGTVVQLAQRGPGDFCSPAAQTQTPYHIVVAPRSALPVSFVDLGIERVPCG